MMRRKIPKAVRVVPMLARASWRTWVIVAFAYRIIVTYFPRRVNCVVPLFRLSHIEDSQANDDERKKSKKIDH